MPSKFEPLSLSVVNFSLTDGTNIPPPPDSPPPSRPATADAASAPNGHPSTPPDSQSSANGAVQPPTDTDAAARPSTIAHPPTPDSPKRSSIRRLLSFNRLRTRDSASLPARSPSALGVRDAGPWRPGSPLAGDGNPPPSPHSLTRKRSSGWFASNKRRSGVFGPVRAEEGAGVGGEGEGGEVRGPPPPALPEWSAFRSLDGALESVHEMDGEDLFKGIGREG